MGGNTPLGRMVNGKWGCPFLLIIRDSYPTVGSVPVENFSDIQLLDLRYFHTSLSAFIADHGFDYVLSATVWIISAALQMFPFSWLNFLCKKASKYLKRIARKPALY
jgi:hypothetical protein